MYVCMYVCILSHLSPLPLLQREQPTITHTHTTHTHTHRRKQLERLAALPDDQVRCVGELIFSADVSSDSTYHIDHGAKGTLVLLFIECVLLL